MKKAVCLAILLFAAFAISAQHSNQFGLVFNLKNILSVDSFTDGYQTGAGAKYYLTEQIALRALIGIDHNTDTAGNSKTTIGLGLAGEYHFASGTASPYVGPLAGFRALAQTGASTLADLYLGGLCGVEAKILPNLSVYAEYDLVASWDSLGFSVHFGSAAPSIGGAVFGLIAYF